jgi:hypothetical protein
MPARHAPEPQAIVQQGGWQERLQAADRAAFKEHPALALIHITYFVPFGDYTQAGYEYTYTDPSGRAIKVRIRDTVPYQPIVSVFEEGEALASASFAEWQQREALLRGVATTPQEIITITTIPAKETDATARISYIYITAHPELQDRLNTNAVWIVTYVIERTGKAQIFYVDADENVIIDQWQTMKQEYLSFFIA